MIQDGEPDKQVPDVHAVYPIVVLLVDDQLMVGEMVRRALAGQADISLHHCLLATEAMAHAERLRPSVILQDLLLPDGDGLELVRTYRDNARTRDVPVIVLSVKEEPAVKSDAFKLGATDYLVKLPDPIELVARIRHHARAFLNQIQRDQAFRALRESQEQLVVMNLELKRLSNSDGLTGLANRRHLNELLESEWKRAVRSREALSVLMIDVDDFKRYNDHYGHLAGDEVLKTVADAVRAAAERPADLAARFGGEEFILVLPCTELAGALFVAEKLRMTLDMLALPHAAASSNTHLTVSIGVASTVPLLGDRTQRLVGASDAALYEAKRTGRNRVCGHLLEPITVA
ncbi:diguanylate cyclase [Massilia sp. CCM 8734]|nr:diguanylate cyclase [Massilia sp. CCM 8734]